jgi:hypothetical protein
VNCTRAITRRHRSRCAGGQHGKRRTPRGGRNRSADLSVVGRGVEEEDVGTFSRIHLDPRCGSVDTLSWPTTGSRQNQYAGYRMPDSFAASTAARIFIRAAS